MVDETIIKYYIINQEKFTLSQMFLPNCYCCDKHQRKNELTKSEYFKLIDFITVLKTFIIHLYLP